MSDDKPGRGSDQFALRFPEGLRDKVKELAQYNDRSMNAEIVERLKMTYSPNALYIPLPEKIVQRIVTAAQVQGFRTTEEYVADLLTRMMPVLEPRDEAVRKYHVIATKLLRTLPPEERAELEKEREAAFKEIAKFIDD